MTATTTTSPEFVEQLKQRLSRLTPETSRRWGRMTAHEMVCHLTDSFRTMLGERPVNTAFNWSPFRRWLTRFVALRTPLPWPKGLETLPEVNPHRQGSRPAEFVRDQSELLAAMHRFVANDAQYRAHPMFGTMSRDDWMRWTFRHVDHHLRQFGL